MCGQLSVHVFIHIGTYTYTLVRIRQKEHHKQKQASKHNSRFRPDVVPLYRNHYQMKSSNIFRVFEELCVSTHWTGLSTTHFSQHQQAKLCVSTHAIFSARHPWWTTRKEAFCMYCINLDFGSTLIHHKQCCNAGIQLPSKHTNTAYVATAAWNG